MGLLGVTASIIAALIIPSVGRRVFSGKTKLPETKEIVKADDKVVASTNQFGSIKSTLINSLSGYNSTKPTPPQMEVTRDVTTQEEIDDFVQQIRKVTNEVTKALDQKSLQPKTIEQSQDEDDQRIVIDLIKDQITKLPNNVTEGNLDAVEHGLSTAAMYNLFKEKVQNMREELEKAEQNMEDEEQRPTPTSPQIEYQEPEEEPFAPSQNISLFNRIQQKLKNKR
ncbi:hypothetical protein AKO1_011115 [Acrasis kona]|uniref:Uncharacterized protein n=1 Tax=Acrasis kona TaxID=1008807 RepID=A0AAW2YYX5_9EUKA